MKSGIIKKKYLKTRVELKLFERKLEFWKLFENWNSGKLFENRSFENWNFEELFENGIFKN